MDINITSQVAQTITNGVTTTAPSQDAVFDALALKQSTSEKNQTNGYVGINGTNGTTILSASGIILNTLIANTTDNRDYYLQDSSGTIAFLSDVATKQDALVSGTNIKTINSTTLLGSGNISVQETLVSATNIKTVNGTSLLGSGDLVVGGVAITSGYIPKGTGTTIADGLMYDNGTSISIGAGTSPSAKLHVQGTGATSSTFSAKFQNSSSVVSLQVRDDGSVYNLGGSSIAENLAFGIVSLNNNTTGIHNVSLGNSCLRENTTGNYNIAIGSSSLLANTTGQWNIGIGYNALTVANGNYNIAIGYNTMRQLSSGEANVAVGWSALEAVTTGSNNTGIGQFTLGKITTGAENTGVGQQAGFLLTTANANTAVGYEALLNAVTSPHNTALGHKALRSATGGGYSVAVGSAAAFTTTSGEGNVSIGASSHYELTTGNNNVAIGLQAGRYATTQSDELFIHNGKGVTNRATSLTNSLVYGIFDATVANQRLRINANVGIGGNAPTATSTLNIGNIPTSSAGLASGDVWSNAGVLTIV